MYFFLTFYFQGCVETEYDLRNKNLGQLRFCVSIVSQCICDNKNTSKYIDRNSSLNCYLAEHQKISSGPMIAKHFSRALNDAVT